MSVRSRGIKNGWPLGVGTRDSAYVPAAIAPPAAPTLQPVDQGNAYFGDSLYTGGTARQFTVHKVIGTVTGNLVVTLAGFTEKVGYGQQPLGNSVSVSVAIEYPLGSGTFSTVASTSVASGLYVDFDTGWAVPANGSPFGLFVYAAGANLPVRGTGGANNVELYTDEACEVGAAVSSTPTNAPTDSFSRRRRLCVVVALSAARTTNDTIALLGDSITAGTSSALLANFATSDHARGHAARVFSQYYAVYNLGLGSDQPSSAFYSNRPCWRMLWGRAGKRWCGYFINEWNNRAYTIAEVQAIRRNVLTFLNGKPLLEDTIGPRVASTTDTYSTEAGQTAATYASELDTFNATVLAASAFDSSQYIKGTNPQVFIVNGTTNYATTDGLHRTLTAIGLIMAQAAAMKAAMDAAPVAAITQPSFSLGLTNTPTFSTGFIRGTATGLGCCCTALPASGEAYVTVTTGTGAGASTFAITCGAAGRAYVNTTGVLGFRDGGGTQTLGTTNVVGIGEFHVEWCYNGTQFILRLNGVTEITRTVTPTVAQTDKSILVVVPNGGGKIRGVASFVGTRHTVDFSPPAFGYLTPSSDPTCVGYWPLLTDGSGQIGGYLVQ